MPSHSIFSILDFIGMVAFSFSGAIAGVRKQMDMYGVFLLAAVTAMGGGTIRDFLIGNIPATVIVDPIVIVIPFGASVAIFFMRNMVQRDYRTLLVMDAIGLGMFTISGVSFGLQYDVPLHGALLLGVITSTAGGITRDLLGGEIPLVLRRDIYASASIVGGLLYWFLLVSLQINPDVAALTCTAVVIVVRVLAFQRNWHLPYPHKSIASTDVQKDD